MLLFFLYLWGYIIYFVLQLLLFIHCYITYRAIQKQIATSSPIRKLVALLFLRISMVYMEAKRIYEVLIKANFNIISFFF